MQAQLPSTEAQSLSNSTSLQCVETLLRAGLGCIAYLRGLLPSENFAEYHLSAEINNALSRETSTSFSSDNRSQRTISGVTIMNLKRGFTNEGDKILDYLEHGIFDAIKKQYLRRFVFAIYVDNSDPNNIIEAYTFDFQYHKIPGTSTTVPIMSLGDQLSKMTLAYTGGRDPMAEALKHGKLPTLGEVKRSLKLMIKTLVTTISHMEGLPKSRYGNFKLFFNELAPDDYQPPHFRPGDMESHKWFFSTHGTNEVPERICIGSFETGWHGVNLTVTSVSSYLPSATEDNNARFAGITANSAPKLTPVEEARLRTEDANLQRKDALDRNVVWDADCEEDAIGEETFDEGIVLTRFSGTSAMVPAGVRGDDGSIQPIPMRDKSDVSTSSTLFGGVSEVTPVRVGELTTAQHVKDTQLLPATLEVEMNSLSSVECSVQSLPPSDMSGVATCNAPTQKVDTQIIQERLRQQFNSLDTSDTEMLDMETQAPPVQEQIHRKTKSITRICEPSAMEEGKPDCECGTTNQGDCIFCEGGCQRWHHIWCMGYHGVKDKRLPEQFICYDCRLRKSPEWDIIAGKIQIDMVSRFKDLALFRHAIKIFELIKPETVMQFKNQLGCTPALASQLLARLEDEGFIANESTITDGLGCSREVTRQKKKQSRGKVKKTQKELHRTQYVFLQACKRGQGYHDYFNPDPAVENRLMGLANKRSSHAESDDCCSMIEQSSHSTRGFRTNDSQPQALEPSRNVLMLAIARQTESNLKRKSGNEGNELTKKIKVSIGTPVDLCD